MLAKYALTVVLCVLLAVPGLADPFESVHDASVSLNPPGITSSLCLAGNRTTYQIGEVIPIIVSFSAEPPANFRQMTRSWSICLFTAFVCAPSAPTCSGPVGRKTLVDDALITARLVEIRHNLNECLRFNKPGTYSLYAVSRLVFPNPPNPPDDHPVEQTVTSTCLRVRIVPQQPGWASAQALAATAQLAAPADWRAQKQAIQVLQNLGTPESAHALLREMSTQYEPRATGDDSYDAAAALALYPNQHWLIGEMRGDLADPNYTVTESFLYAIAACQMRLSPKADWNAAWSEAAVVDWLTAAESLPRRKGQIRAETLAALVKLAYTHQVPMHDRRIQQTLPALVHALPSAFAELPQSPQQDLLQQLWIPIRQPAMRAPLLHLWLATRPDDNTHACADLILRRIYDLDPVLGRTLLLQEIQSRNPRIDRDGIGFLPDRTLPGLDRHFAQRIGYEDNASQFTYDLIARYGSIDILPIVKRRYLTAEGRWACAPQADMLAYFLRVDAALGASSLAKALTLRQDTRCYRSVLGDVAALYYDPNVEQIAEQSLDDPDQEVETDAAKTLSRHGSPNAKASLLARLASASAAGRDQGGLQDGLVDSLLTASNWLIDSNELSRMRNLCTSVDALQSVSRYPITIGRQSTNLTYSIDDEDWDIGPYSGRGAPSFLNKLAQYPPGGVFDWAAASDSPEEAATIAKVKAFAQVHHLTVTVHVL